MLRYSETKAPQKPQEFRKSTEVISTSSCLRQHCMCNSFLIWLPKKSTASIKLVKLTVAKFRLLIKKKTLNAIDFLQMPN